MLLTPIGKRLPGGVPVAPVTSSAPTFSAPLVAALTSDASTEEPPDLIAAAAPSEPDSTRSEDDASSRRKARRAARRQRMRAWMASAGLDARQARRHLRSARKQDLNGDLGDADGSIGDLIETFSKARMRRALRLGGGR
jgi:hypothetical protein